MAAVGAAAGLERIGSRQLTLAGEVAAEAAKNAKETGPQEVLGWAGLQLFVPGPCLPLWVHQFVRALSLTSHVTLPQVLPGQDKIKKFFGVD